MTTPSQSPAKPQFWRIQGIRTGERDISRKWLQELVKELDISEGEGYSLARADERTLCATVTSFVRPSPPNRSWYVDDKFEGFTPLNEPDHAVVDVVAVTGLGGHPLGSFRSEDGASVWLRDFAPTDLPEARFITYGYDTRVSKSESNQGIGELAHTLLGGLDIFRRRSQTADRPICFLCHSLGGVIVKQALVKASRARDERGGDLFQVMEATHGLILMGVPNLGLKNDQLATAVKGRPNLNFIRDLMVREDGEASQFLQYLMEDFAHLDRWRQPPFEIVSYYETMRSPTVRVSTPLHFKVTGRWLTL